MLDGYRGFAVAAVLLFHGHVLRGGWLGVDFFFVLSGFLITRLLVHERAATDHTNLGDFWRRRGRRLLPALVVFLVGVAVWTWWYPDPQLLPPDLAKQAVASIAYVANWYQLHAGLGYWDRFGVPSPLSHLWSLAVEEQFYVLFPAVFLGVVALHRRFRAGTLVLVAGAVTSWALGVLLLATSSSVDRVYLGTDSRIGAVLIGAACGHAVASGPLRPPVARVVHLLTPAAGAVVVAAVVVAEGSAQLSAARWLLLPVFELAVCVLLVEAVAPRPAEDRVSRGLQIAAGSGLLVWLGTISYGLYLWHFPVFLAVERQFTTAPRVVVLAIGVAVSLGIAQVSYLVVERPIRERGLAVAPRFVVVTVGLLLVVVSVAWIHSSTQTARTYRAARTGAVGTADLSSGAAPNDTPSTTNVIPPTLPFPRPAGRPPRVLLVGDSLAFEMVQQFRPTIDRLGLDGGIASAIGCGTGGLELSRDGTGGQLVAQCRKFVGSLPSVVEEVRPDVVVLVRAAYRISIPPSETKVDVCGADYQQWYRGALADELTSLRSTGAPVAVATMVYDRYRSVDHTVGDREVACINESIRAVVAATPGTAVLPLSEWVCPSLATCRTTDQGTVLRPDGIHFQGKGATRAIEWIAEQVLGPSR